MEIELARPRWLSVDGALVALSLGVAAVGAYTLARSAAPEAQLAGTTMVVLGLLLTTPRFLLRVRLTAGAVEVRVVTGRRTFPYRGLGQARVVDGRLAVRLLGVGAASYHTGQFHLTGHGRVRAYSSTFSGPFVLIERSSGAPLVLSPQDPQAFLERLERVRGG